MKDYEKEIIVDDLINTVLTEDMKYEEIIDSIKDYFGINL